MSAVDRPPAAWPRRLLARVRRAAGRVLRLAPALLAAAASAQTAGADCPPAPQAPSAEQIQTWVREARDRGLLWRISRDGRTSWLYGTLHVGRGAWAVPGPQVRAALQAADALALELDITDPATLQALAEATRPPAPAAAATAGPSERGQRLARLAAAHCVDPALLAGQPPALQATTLSVLAARRDGLEPAYGQEPALAGFARARRLPIVALETVGQQLAALPQGDDARRLLEQTLAMLEDGRARALLHRLAEAWERGDLQTLADYEGWCDCAADAEDRALLAQLNDARNPGLADGIERQHAQGRSVFAAVGALHMTGPQGLPGLLARRGWRVERVPLAPPR